MGKILIIAVFFLPLIAHSHPGIGIVKDSKGNIYYSDLKQVWKISNGIKKLVVPNVHTHELYIDKADNLYGENGYYDGAADKHYYYYWVYRPNGIIDTVLGMREAYIRVDFSFSRDQQGNEYYTSQFLVNGDTNHIYRRTPHGVETIFATGNFKGLKWLHPQDDGSLLYVLGNNLYRINSTGLVQLVKSNVGNAKPVFEFSRPNNITLWSAWQDRSENVYVAVFSDQAIRKINARGNLSDVYRSTGNWTPLNGIFDNKNRLWVLEGSDKNEMRAVMADAKSETEARSNHGILTYVIVFCIVLGIVLFVLKLLK